MTDLPMTEPMTDEPLIAAAVPDPAKRPTLTVPEAARLLRIGRDAAYAAVDRGDVPSFRLGRRIVVPTAKLLAMLGVFPGRDPEGGAP